MSYDLDFWSYESEPGSDGQHQAVYEMLCDGGRVQGLREIPVSDILQRVVSVFAAEGWTAIDDWTWDGDDKGGFQVSLTTQLFRVDCSNMDGDDMNRFIDIAHEFGLRLYDPQVGTRYAGWRSDSPPGRSPRTTSSDRF